MGAECEVIFNQKLIGEGRYFRKQACQLASKMRYLSAQFTAFLSNELWLRCARHANDMAQLLAAELRKLDDVAFTQPVESNQLFLTMPIEKSRKLHEQYYFYYWNEPEGEMRLVTSWDTTEDDIHGLISHLKTL